MSPNKQKRRWRPSLITVLASILAAGSLVAFTYPSTASWFSTVNQAGIAERSVHSRAELDPGPGKQIELARQYNDALVAGVQLEAGGNVPVGTGNTADVPLVYKDMLHAGRNGLMARIRIPSINVDLPIYHGTDEDTLLRGAGHLEGTHLPVGGSSTRSVVTAHRGLASSRMFTNLDQVTEGDRFVIETMGEAFTYQVISTEVIDPNDTAGLRAEPGRDLVTLITCTPLGINSHRILVTGERISPTPLADRQQVGEASGVVGFPWWAVWAGGGLTVLVIYITHRGFKDAAGPHRGRTDSTGTSNS